MNSCLLLYVPVIHEGYLQFLSRYEGHVLCIGENLIKEISNFDYIARKDRIRRVQPGIIKVVLEAIFPLRRIVVIDSLGELANTNSYEQIFLPDEDLTRAMAEKFLDENKVVFVNTFLRWNRDNLGEEKTSVGRCVHGEEFSVHMKTALRESSRSSDWWRSVGAVLVKDGQEIIVACNAHHPDEQSPYVFGDPRSISKRGMAVEISTAEHAEATVLGVAARRGFATEGCDLYSTDFPCPPCAKLIARSGIKNLYYLRGYSVLDGKTVLENAEINIFRVEL